MSTITTPSKRINRNQAINTSFIVEIPTLNSFNYFVQNTEIPGMTSVGTETPYNSFNTNVPTNSILYDPLNITFIVGEDFENYNSIRLWMHKITCTEPVVPSQMKNMTLHVLNSNKVPIAQICFYKAYPMSLTPIAFETGVSDTTPLICSAIFRYQYFDFVYKGSEDFLDRKFK